MATSITVKGKVKRRPGMYSQIKSGVKNAPSGLSFGNVLLIDTAGLLNGWAAGAGINGELTQKNDAFYTFDNIDDYRSHVKGGYLWKLGEPLFTPRRGSAGASQVTVVKPATTTASEISLTDLENGSIVIQTLDEGTGSDGVLTSGNLSKGYAAKIFAGVVDTSKVFFRFYRSTYRGVNGFNTGRYYNNTTPASAKPELIVESPEFLTLQEFVDWMSTDNTFKTYFKLKSGYLTTNSEISTVTTIAEGGAKEVADITFPATAGATQGDYVVVTNAAGVTYAIWLDIDNNGTVPTGAAYVAATNKIEVDIATGDTSTQVAGKVKAAVELHASWATANITISGSGATRSFTQTKSGITTDPVPHDSSDSTAGSITISVTTQGVASALNSKYFSISSPTINYYVWFNANSEGVDPAISGKTGVEVALSTGASDVQVAVATAAAIDALPGFTVPVPSTNTFTITNTNSGAVTDPTANTSGFTITVTDQGSGDFVSDDLTTYPDYILAAGGTESYSSSDLDTVFDYINDLDFTFILSTSNADLAQSTENESILDFLINTSKYERILFVGGGYDSSKFKLSDNNSSLETAAFFDSDLVCVVHGGTKKAISGSVDFEVYDSLYKTFQAVGRACGLAPQVPLTLKSIDIDGDVHQLTEKEQETALVGGVIYSYYDTDLETFVIAQGVTSLQNNSNLINDDGTTFSLQLKRIVSQINKELVYNAKRTFFSNDLGPNRNSLSSESIASFTDGFLSKKLARATQDNLLVGYRNIVVTEESDNFSVSYEMIPNTEVNKGLFTGFILEK